MPTHSILLDRRNLSYFAQQVPFQSIIQNIYFHLEDLFSQSSHLWYTYLNVVAIFGSSPHTNIRITLAHIKPTTNLISCKNLREKKLYQMLMKLMVTRQETTTNEHIQMKREENFLMDSKDEKDQRLVLSKIEFLNLSV